MPFTVVHDSALPTTLQPQAILSPSAAGRAKLVMRHPEFYEISIFFGGKRDLHGVRLQEMFLCRLNKA